MSPSSLREGPELIIGLVGAVGTELELVTRQLTDALAAVDYSTVRVARPSESSAQQTSIRLATLLHKITKYEGLPSGPIDVYIDKHLTAGDDFREVTDRNDALAILAMADIREERKNAAETGHLKNQIIPRRAYVLRSLKHPAELETLRQVYADAFLSIAAYSPHHARRDHLARRIAESRAETPERHLDKAEFLIQRDQEELDAPHGQNVRGIFHQADVFVDTTNADLLKQSVDRFVELLFGNSFHTPTREEYGMFHARAAALRSAEPGRQVGAAIASEQGDIIAVGVNDVPKAGGGLYWYGDSPDGREFVAAQQSGETQLESNQKHIRNLVIDTMKHLKKAGWLHPTKDILAIDELADLALKGKQSAIPKSAHIRNLIEFGRAVHAEMDALSDAARRGISVAGCTMYVTTFPCHLCVRHIVAAGIREVIFIEPYAKSLAADLYPDSIAIEQECNNKVQFKPFVGVAPRQYLKLFSMTARKSVEGVILLFNPSTANLRYYGIPRVYLDSEEDEVATLNNILIEKGLKREAKDGQAI